MNKETFAKYISNPTLLDNDSLPEIKAMLDEFPYFQSAWVLYIKNLHTIKDIRYESKLKTACAYISDRKHLHDILKGAYIPAIAPVQTQFIASPIEENPEEIAIVQPQNLVAQNESEANTTENVQTQFIASQEEEETIPQQEEILEDSTIVQTQNLASQPEEIAENTTSVQAQFIASQPEEEAEANTTENVQTQNIASQEITPAQIKALLEKQLHDIGINANITFSGNSANIQFENIATDEKPEENKPEQPIAEDESSTEITTAPTIEEQIEKRKNDRNKKANLIDKFIESKAKIVPKKDYHSDNKLSTESIIEDEELFTEQLAKIYIKQGHLEKALETYEKLYLKYPEKNIYFATRIEYVKRLMNK